MIYTHDEAIGIVELFEEILEFYGITVPSDDDDEREPDNAARVFGDTYWNLVDDIENRLIDISIRAKNGEGIAEGSYPVPQTGDTGDTKQ